MQRKIVLADTQNVPPMSRFSVLVFHKPIFSAILKSSREFFLFQGAIQHIFIQISETVFKSRCNRKIFCWRFRNTANEQFCYFLLSDFNYKITITGIIYPIFTFTPVLHTVKRPRRNQDTSIQNFSPQKRCEKLVPPFSFA